MSAEPVQRPATTPEAATDAAAASSWLVPAPGVAAGWLNCRRVRRADADAVYEAVTRSADHLRPWMPWANGYTAAMARDFAARSAAQPGNPAVPEVSYAICDRAGRLLGVCGLHARLGPGALEIGYWVDVQHTRGTVATLAAAALTELALSLPDVAVAEIHHDQANVRSGAVAARLGYRQVAALGREPQAPGEIGVEVQWRMTCGAWPRSPGAALLARAREAPPGHDSGARSVADTGPCPPVEPR